VGLILFPQKFIDRGEKFLNINGLVENGDSVFPRFLRGFPACVPGKQRRLYIALSTTAVLDYLESSMLLL
jgi:hypothetical protein